LDQRTWRLAAENGYREVLESVAYRRLAHQQVHLLLMSL